MKKIFLTMAIMLLTISFVLAQQRVHEPGTGLENPEVKEKMNGSGQGLEDSQMQGSGQGKMITKSGEFIGSNGQKMNIQMKAQNQYKLEVEGVSVNCSCNMTQEQVQNRTQLHVKLSNGKNSEVKIMPNKASETALQKLRLKNCNETRNCTIELKEVGKDSKARLAYELKTQRNSKVFGIFRAKMNVEAKVDAETGEVIKVNKPWWAFLASEPSEE